ncbi:PREDICTED: uncharacterized protein LOC109586201 [Amphimedon queenslandica]|uniref:Death domain-containing protein n=1 Tax=Amphimedon queenslandica TaxID=400682 RepID=A0A1X7TSY0_AMPQE|nr:PREDICTED: uncharacterized protein LOC109586201 [Amphimedon queenslandica]|eukprot:XP_019857935.1 PREDICTED: uncharacterized protein LOC109586201 [Amphimedon queenslandica]
MASCSPSVSLQTLSIDDLNDVLQLLKDCDFPDKEWMTLGLNLGLTKNTLDSIEANHPRDVHRCLVECLSKWLKKADKVISPTHETLSTAARSIMEIAVAEKISERKDQEKINHVLALSIFDSYYSKLLQTLSDPATMAYKLHKEGVFEREVLERIESESSSISKQREILLDSLKEKVVAQYTCLETFIISLCKFTDDTKEGLAMKKDYEANGIKIQSERQLEENQGLKGSVLYNGILYHQQKEVGCWETTLAVGKDANALIQHIKSTFPHAEQDTSISFTFTQPNGILELKLSPVGRVPCEYGWRLDPKQEPMQVLQSFVDNALMGSCSMSVSAKPGVATEPIRHPIKLLGIEPETTIYINRQPPPSPSPAAPLEKKISNESILAMHKYEIGGCSDYGSQVIAEESDRIKKNLKLTPKLMQSLVEREVIKEEIRDFFNETYDMTDNERMNMLLSFVKAAVKNDGDNFLFFLEAMRDQDSAKANELADDLKEFHDDMYRNDLPNAFVDGKFVYLDY